MIDRPFLLIDFFFFFFFIFFLIMDGRTVAAAAADGISLIFSKGLAKVTVFFFFVIIGYSTLHQLQMQ
jgi:hypothetical protein